MEVMKRKQSSDCFLKKFECESGDWFNIGGARLREGFSLFKKNLFIYFIFGCVGSSLLSAGFL